jgi:hypothetical protein
MKLDKNQTDFQTGLKEGSPTTQNQADPHTDTDVPNQFTLARCHHHQHTGEQC